MGVRVRLPRGAGGVGYRQATFGTVFSPRDAVWATIELGTGSRSTASPWRSGWGGAAKTDRVTRFPSTAALDIPDAHGGAHCSRKTIRATNR